MIQFCASVRGLPSPVALSQRRTSYVSEGRLRTLGSPLLALLLQAQGGAVLRQCVRHRDPQPRRRLRLSSPSRSRSSSRCSVDRLVGHLPLQVVDVPARRSASPRSFSTCSAGATSSRKSRRSADRSSESPLVGLFQAGYAELTAQLRQALAEMAQRAQSTDSAAGRPTLKSLTAVDRALMRASVRRSQQAGAAACRSWRPRRASRRSSACSARCGAS